MKIKFVFVPLSILFSIVLAIWYIWPIWQDSEGIKDYQKKIAIKKCELEEANSKIQNAKDLSDFLNSEEGKTSSGRIYDYLASDEKKEEVINNINHAAGSSSVSIININIEDTNLSSSGKENQDFLLVSKKSDSGDAETSLSMQKCLGEVAEKYGDAADTVNAENLNPFSNSNLDLGTEKVEASSGSDVLKNSTKLIKANVSVAGTYKQLIVFFDNLYRMKMLNNITSVNIKKETKEGENNQADFLSMDVTVYSGYLPKNSKDVSNFNDPIFEKKSFDLAAVDKLSRIIDAGEISIGETGKDNPFSP